MVTTEQNRPRFVVDENVGKLAKALRLLGFDTVFFNGESDSQMVRLAQAEHRIILTRDTHILERRLITTGKVKAVLVKSDNIDAQIEQVINELNLIGLIRPFTLCLEDSHPLVVRTKDEVSNRVPPYVFQTQNEYMECPKCHRVYWKGTHWQAMTRRLEKISKKVSEDKIMNNSNQPGKLTSELLDRLEKIVGRQNLVTDEGRENYARDEAPKTHDCMPEAVIKPQDTQMVAQILNLANQFHIPVTPRGAGTGLSGGSVPVFGGISLSLEKMNQILEIDEANFCVRTQAGVVLKDLCDAVGEHGLYYPLYPGEMDATIGGNVSTNAGGMRAVKYGVTRNFVLGLEAVLPTGEIIHTGGKYIKSATGYDLTQLLIGSEGTLAVITEATLKLITPPGDREILLIPFNSLTDAIRFVPVILKEKYLPVSIEFMEQNILELVINHTGKELPVPLHPAFLMLMIECESYDEFCNISEHISQIAQEHGAVDVFVPGSESAKRRLLEIREQFYPTMQHSGMADIADVVVPRSQIAVFIEQVKRISQDYDIPVVTYGHAGDGNVHLHPLKQDAVKDARVKDLLSDIYRAGIEFGGTISGEHGLGADKKKYLPLAFNGEKLALMRRLKFAFDPNNIMNPGKVL